MSSQNDKKTSIEFCFWTKVSHKDVRRQIRILGSFEYLSFHQWYLFVFFKNTIWKNLRVLWLYMKMLKMTATWLLQILPVSCMAWPWRIQDRIEENHCINSFFDSKLIFCQSNKALHILCQETFSKGIDGSLKNLLQPQMWLPPQSTD